MFKGYQICQMLSKDFKGCQYRLSKISKFVKGCQMLSKVVKCCQRLSKVVKKVIKGCQKRFSNVFKGYHSLSNLVKGFQRLSI